MRVSVAYDSDIEGAAEALLAVLRTAPQAERASRKNLSDDEAIGADEETAA